MFNETKQKLLADVVLPPTIDHIPFWDKMGEVLQPAEMGDEKAYSFELDVSVSVLGYEEMYSLLCKKITAQFNQAGEQGVALPRYSLVSPTENEHQELIRAAVKKYQWTQNVMIVQSRPQVTMSELRMPLSPLDALGHTLARRSGGLTRPIPTLQLLEDESGDAMVPLEEAQWDDSARAGAIDVIAATCLNQQVRMSTVVRHTKGLKYIVKYSVAEIKYHNPENVIEAFMLEIKSYLAQMEGSRNVYS